jgi:ABC-type uncharacterized transport system involved in gliding motility auxiliary subunit
MHYTPRRLWQLRLANIVFVLLFLLAVGLLQWLSRTYSLRVDLTNTARHSLSAASIAAAERLKGPLKITAFASQRGEQRARIQELVGRYQRHKADIELIVIDPDEAPDKVRAAGVQHDGELLFEHADAKERLAPPTRLDEEAFTNTLTRLGHRGERWVLFLAGHGERSPERPANFDLSTWVGELRKRGFLTRTLSLAESPQIPANASMLVIAAPRTRLLAGEIKAIQRYLERGGNLLWLADPGPQHGLEALAESLGIELLPGVAVDPTSQAITGNAAAIVIAAYGAHPVVRDFVDVTLFPQAGALQVNPPKGWRSAALLDTRESAWLETGSVNEAVAFDKGKDLRGPLTLGVALTRTPEGAQQEQRVAMIADGDFLSNAFIANGGNVDLGLSLVNWLSRDDAYVSIPVRAARDRRLELSRGAQIGLVGVFLFGLPLAMIGGGVTVWWRRRKR